MNLYSLLDNNKIELDRLFSNSADYYFKYFKILNFRCGISVCEDLVSIQSLQENFFKIVSEIKGDYSIEEFIDYIIFNSTIPASNTTINTFEDAITAMTSGFAIVFIDGSDRALTFPVQSFPSRGVDKPTNENNLRGSKESFTDVGRKNMSLVRRRIRTNNLVIKTLQCGNKTKTEISLFYHSDYCPKELVNSVEESIKNIELPAVFDPGYIAPFIDKTKYSLFNAVGYTEKADTFCAKICEGKVGIMVDGAPYALVYPYFFTENFVTNDDYAQRPYYASFIRILRIIGFVIAISLPAVYVAFAAYVPQSLTTKLLYKIYFSQNSTPLPLFIEAILINIIFEIVKEAGLRLPESIGGSVSLISALIIGESAVNIGIVGNVILIVCAISAISSFIIPSLHESIIILRMIFLILAGLFGIVGISMATIFLFMNIVNIDTFGYNFNNIYNRKTIFKDGILKDSFRNENGEGFSLINAKNRSK